MTTQRRSSSTRRRRSRNTRSQAAAKPHRRAVQIEHLVGTLTHVGGEFVPKESIEERQTRAPVAREARRSGGRRSRRRARTRPTARGGSARWKLGMCRPWDLVLCHGMCCIGGEPTTNKAYLKDFTASLEASWIVHRKPPRLRHPRALGLVGGGASTPSAASFSCRKMSKGVGHLLRRLVVEDGHHARGSGRPTLASPAPPCRRGRSRSLARARAATAERDAENRRVGVGEGRRALEVALRDELRWPTTRTAVACASRASVPQHAGGGARAAAAAWRPASPSDAQSAGSAASFCTFPRGGGAGVTHFTSAGRYSGTMRWSQHPP